MLDYGSVRVPVAGNPLPGESSDICRAPAGALQISSDELPISRFLWWNLTGSRTFRDWTNANKDFV